MSSGDDKDKDKEMVGMDMMDMDDMVMVDTVDIFQGWIFFRSKYFSGATIF